MKFVYKNMGILILACLASALGACSPAAKDAGASATAQLLGVATVNPRHPMTGNPVGGFSGLTYDPVAQAWLVVSSRQPEPIAYTLRTSYDPRPESEGNAWVAGEFSAWLGREWPLPAGAEDAEAVAIRRTASGNHQRFWAFERDPSIVIEDLRTGTSSPITLPREVVDHYRFDGAFKALAVVPEEVGDRLWAAVGAPLTIDDLSGMSRVIAFAIDNSREPESFLYPLPSEKSELSALSTIPGTGWRDAHPVFAIETRSRDIGPILRLVAIDAENAEEILDLPVLNRRVVADLTEVLAEANALAPQNTSVGMAIGPEIADRQGGHLVLVVTTNNRRQPDAQHLVYAFRVMLN